MRYALPIALILCLAAVIALSPHIEPQRLRSRARLLAEQLRAQHGFRVREGSKASWAQARSTGWPPFHYGPAPLRTPTPGGRPWFSRTWPARRSQLSTPTAGPTDPPSRTGRPATCSGAFGYTVRRC